MVVAVCPGSFDPLTVGHVGIIERTARLFDEVVVAVGTNVSKSRLFSAEERLEMIAEVFAEVPNVRPLGFSGLVTTLCAQLAGESGQAVIVKGIRDVADVAYENHMAHMNRHLTGVDTIYLPTEPGQSFISSSLVKEVAGFGGDISAFLPPGIAERLLRRLAERES